MLTASHYRFPQRRAGSRRNLLTNDMRLLGILRQLAEEVVCRHCTKEVLCLQCNIYAFRPPIGQDAAEL